MGGSGGLNLAATSQNVGTLELLPTTSNSFTGGLTLSAGNLVFNNNSALGASSGLISVTGGTLIPTTAVTLTNPLVQLAGSIALAGASNLSLSAGTATTLVSNSTINLSNYTGTATLAGVVSGGGPLTIAGITGLTNNLGQVVLSNTNTYIGGTTISGGVVTVGSSTVTSGGFITSGSVGTGTLTVTGGTISGSGQTLANPLSIGATAAGVQLNGTLNFTGTGVLTASSNLVVNGTTTLSGPISGTNFSLTQSGTGTLQLMAPETYTGTTTVNAGTVILGGNGSILNSNTLVVNQGGALTLDNNTGGISNNNSNRLVATATLTLNGGSFNFTGNTTAPSSATIGTLLLNSGSSVITLTGTSSTLSATGSTSLTRVSTGATLAYQPATTGTQQVLITGTLPTLTSGILPYVTVGTGSTTQFATINGTNFLVAGTTISETLNAANPLGLDNVSLPSGDTETLAANTVINSLTVPNGATINLNGKTLTITSGGLLNDGGSGAPVSFTNGTVLFGTSTSTDGIVFNANGGSITFGTTANITGTGGLTVGGNGTVNINNANTFLRRHLPERRHLEPRQHPGSEYGSSMQP